MSLTYRDENNKLVTVSEANPLPTTASISGDVIVGEVEVEGAVAAGAADSGNPVKVGGVYSTSAPALDNGDRGDLQLNVQSSLLVGGRVADDAAQGTTYPLAVGGAYTSTPPTYTDGDRTQLRTGTRGSLRVEIMSSDSATPIGTGSPTIDGLSGSINSLGVQSRNLVFNGTNWDRLRGDANAISTARSLSSEILNYAGATGGITDTTAATMFASAGASRRNYLDAIQYFNSAAVASEIAVRDGAGGTVLWRGFVPASMTMPAVITFPTPIKGSAATLMEVVVLTTGTATRVSAQGHTGI